MTPGGRPLFVRLAFFVIAIEVVLAIIVVSPIGQRPWVALSTTIVAIALSALFISFTAVQHRRSAERQVTDVTRRCGDEITELQNRHSEQRSIIASMSSGMIALDLDQRVISVNPKAEEIFGFDGSAARGRLIHELVRDPTVHALVDNAIADDASPTQEVVLAGRDRTIDVTTAPLRNAERTAVGLLLIIDDVTQLRRLEAIRTDFAANVSHELRTPITNIKGYAETLSDILDADETTARGFLDIIQRNTERLEAIVEDLLLLASLESSETRPSITGETVAVSLIFDAALRQVANGAAAKGMTIETDAAPDLEITGAAQLLEQAIGNLLGNAINYAPAGTTVTLSARRVNDETELCVTDEGPGIDPAHHDRLFERFYRVDAARSRKVGGTGLGLAIVKHIALVHGGRAEVDSAPGRGSVFRIVLP